MKDALASLHNAVAPAPPRRVSHHLTQNRGAARRPAATPERITTDAR
jgi:hypothetical protein